MNINCMVISVIVSIILNDINKYSMVISRADSSPTTYEAHFFHGYVSGNMPRKSGLIWYSTPFLDPVIPIESWEEYHSIRKRIGTY